jgi:CheY-like chemotaxis protein
VTLRVALRRGAAPPPSQQLVLSVTDSGIGLTPEALHAVFLPFTQAEESTRARFGGTGLGLAVCKRIADALGGELTAHSDGPGCGATFTFVAPVGEAADGAADAAPPATHAPPVAAAEDVSLAALPQLPRPPLRVLVADDDALCRRILGFALARLGVAASLVEDGAAAVAAFTAAHGGFDLCLLDVQMPRLDGIAATRAILAASAALGTRAPAVHMLTGAVEPAVLAAAKAAGAAGHLAKPMQLPAIGALLEATKLALGSSSSGGGAAAA